MPYVWDVRPLVGPAEGDGDLGPRAIAGVGGGVFYVDDEHPAGGKLSFSSALGGGEAPKDGSDDLIVVLEGVVIAPRWSAASSAIVIVIIRLFGIELLSQAEAVLHLMLGILVEGARAVEDLLILLVIIALGARLINGDDDVV